MRSGSVCSQETTGLSQWTCARYPAAEPEPEAVVGPPRFLPGSTIIAAKLEILPHVLYGFHHRQPKVIMAFLFLVHYGSTNIIEDTI